ncbi:hypothetical protein [Clostridium saccharobutylicum]|uniref:Uncharacterized protein n=1 Tax=Clostridium saccharobutylicum DSM 13864 TaxID=1345695 RepID=U5MPL3_CLOSA|nr:hypothetical protein [Clostridium saccharobutylicum]AGX42433.1 hypothetical protein CLSA_c14330 [Clostridium saccharobutylicum DSM 13864]AQR89718.1 hypothetical protein CLOSC_14210 [Clostridium saccharobutylicum]AQR99620.1 hypothetical protein CSACC_14290 [Clostridium saccharobutylicum]AQS09350.1 hypothetical protein CLOBY_14770 [Clostridium saccharobutylicum]AQS13606.1 hypothetical protein CLOSACC_14290 [Clostridium saccharobutylicum]
MIYARNEKNLNYIKTLVIKIDKVQYARVFDYRDIEVNNVQLFENTSKIFEIFNELAEFCS